MTLDEIRTKIDSVDTQMKPLFLERMACAEAVAETKASSGGDVFVPSREAAILEKRTAGLSDSGKRQYSAFLRYLICLSRRRQYEMLEAMQEQVLKSSGITDSETCRKIKITFCCDQDGAMLGLLVSMAEVNGVTLDTMTVENHNGTFRVTMILEGSLRDSSMRTLLCQIGKETESFSAEALA